MFGLGLAATVAPLTATALNSVEERRAGVASGINNGVSRMAGLLGIAVLGALISGSFTSAVNSDIADANLSSRSQAALTDAKKDPFVPPDTDGLPAPEVDTVQAAATDGATTAFHRAMIVNGILMIIGGVIAGIGIQNPKRREGQIAPRAAAGGLTKATTTASETSLTAMRLIDSRLPTAS